MYSIVDIETTGGNQNQGKITEIAIYNSDGFTITDAYSTLVNPERPIPYFITQLTGITDAMVVNAPTFPEVAEEIVRMTEGNIFVAHNVSFDYRFIQAEFRSLGYQFTRKTLCTVQLGKQVFPGKRSYSLGKFCAEMGIKLDNHHRASADAKATTELFHMILQNDSDGAVDNFLKRSSYNAHINKELVEALPEETGIYFFYNGKNELIYVGKSINIRKRVQSHFSNTRGRKAQDLKNAVTRIEYEVTGNEMIALLREAVEIKRHSPLFNAALRRSTMSFGLFSYTDDDGYIRFEAKRLGKKIEDEPLLKFGTQTEVTRFIERISLQFNLCEKMCGLHKAERHCPAYLANMCEGACLGDELPNDYNERAQLAIDRLDYSMDNFLLIEDGPLPHEVYVIQIEQGQFVGIGLVEKDSFREDPEYLIDFVTQNDPHPDMNHIVRSFVKRNLVANILHY